MDQDVGVSVSRRKSRRRKLKSRSFQPWKESRAAREDDDVETCKSIVSINQSPARTLVLEKVAQETEALVWNIDYRLTAPQLVQEINQSMIHCRIPASGAVTRCQMIGKKGTAVILFANRELFTAFQHLQINVHGRELKVMPGNGASKNRRKVHFHADELAYSILELGASCSPISKFIANWSVNASQPHRIQINVGDKRNIDIDVDLNPQNVRLQCPMKEIRGLSVSRTDCGSIVISFRLVRPPRVFVEDSKITPSNELFPWGSVDLALLSGMKTNSLWELGEDLDAIADVEWSRSTDPSSDNIFSRCLAYRITLPPKSSVENARIVKILFDFGLLKKKEPLEVVISPTNCVKKMQEEPQFDFWRLISSTGVPFAVSYWIHALIGACKLSLFGAAEQDVAKLAHSFCVPDHSCLLGEQILRDIFFDSRRFTLSLTELSNLVASLAASAHFVDDADTAHDESREGQEEEMSTVLVRRVFITPLRICPQAPSLEQSNRILRKWHRFRDNFIRVTFVDEDFGKLFFTAMSPIIVENRLRQVLRYGFELAGRRFVFLAHSNSQMREHGCWYFDEVTPNGHGETPPLADEVRQWVGDLSKITVVGKHAARLGQGFSATTPSITVDDADIMEIPDIMRNGHCFSDGVGAISHQLADEVRRSLGLSKIPSAFQVRFGGGKGVVSVAPIEGYTALHLRALRGIAVRPSMMKFPSSHRELEICTYSKVLPLYLNQQIIQVLGSRGVPDEAFLGLLEDCLASLDSALKSNDAALALLQETLGEMRHQCGGASQLRISLVDHLYAMLECGVAVSTDRFLHGFVSAVRRRQLLDIQAKARIIVPAGVTLIGVIDETGSLLPGQVFIQTRKLSNDVVPAGHQVLVFRNPSLHPGDVQLFTLVDVPALRHLVDVIVFPSTGDRPPANEMSGGDYDGDIYCVIPTPVLFPTVPFAPMDFTPAKGPSITKDAIAVEDIQDNFVHYMQNDNVGRVASAHRVVADLKGAECPECLDLAKCHSDAVDFMKTGVPAVGKMIEKYPDFMSLGRPERVSYESSKVLGVIFRRTVGTNFKDGVMSVELDVSLLVPGFEQYLERAFLLLDEYNASLEKIMAQFDVMDEMEAISGFISGSAARARHGRDVLHGNEEDVRCRLRHAILNLRQLFQALFWEELEHTAVPSKTTVPAVPAVPAMPLMSEENVEFRAHGNDDDDASSSLQSQLCVTEKPEPEKQQEKQQEEEDLATLLGERTAPPVDACLGRTATESSHGKTSEAARRMNGTQFQLHALQQASAWYHAAYSQTSEPGQLPPLISFPWISACDLLVAIKIMATANQSENFSA